METTLERMKKEMAETSKEYAVELAALHKKYEARFDKHAEDAKSLQPSEIIELIMYADYLKQMKQAAKGH